MAAADYLPGFAAADWVLQKEAVVDYSVQDVPAVVERSWGLCVAQNILETKRSDQQASS